MKIAISSVRKLIFYLSNRVWTRNTKWNLTNEILLVLRKLIRSCVFFCEKEPKTFEHFFFLRTIKCVLSGTSLMVWPISQSITFRSADRRDFLLRGQFQTPPVMNFFQLLRHRKTEYFIYLSKLHKTSFSVIPNFNQGAKTIPYCRPKWWKWIP